MLKIQKTIVNKNGIRLVFDNITKYDYFYLTELNNRFGALNLDGIEIIKPIYDKIILTEYGFYIVENNQLQGLINPTGKLVLPIKFSRIETSCYDEMVKILINGKIGFFNIFTNDLVEPIYDFAEHFFKGICKVGRNDKFGFINKKGVEFIPVKYDFISEPYCEVCKTRIKNKWGAISLDGKEILPTDYDEVHGFDFGYGFAKKGNLYICVDKTGKEIFCLDITKGIIRTGEGYQKKSNDYYEEYIEFNCGLIVIKQYGRFHCITSNFYISVDFY